MQDQHVLLSGATIDKYKIIRVLGAGGFGITYLAEDIQLGMKVVIKEYFPNEFAIRQHDSTIIAKTSSVEAFSKGLQRFKEEAQTLAKFSHPSIVKILGYFEANQTGYFVMEYEEGVDLTQYLKEKGTPLGQEEILSIIMPILEGMKEVHSRKYLHRDIKPGNILLRNKKGSVLIDFGASKLALGEASKSITSMLTEGYAPLEQYSTNVKQQGPFTDLYAVGAVMYKMITGKVPPSAQTRSYDLLQDSNDPFEPLITLKLSGYDESFLKAIDRALSIKAKDRPQVVQDFQADIAGKLVHIQKDTNHTTIVVNDNKSWSIIGIIFIFVVILAGYYYANYDMEKSNTTVVNNIQMDSNNVDIKKQQDKIEIERKALEKQKELESEQKREKEQYALEKELKKLKDEKVQAKREEVIRLKKEKEERIAEKKRLERKREKQQLEARRLQQKKEENLYENIDTYHNNRFGFSLKYPSNLLTLKSYPENGDGVWMTNNDGTVEVTPSASFTFNTSNSKQMYREAIEWKNQNKSMEITYKRQKNNWYVLSGYDHSKNIIFYEKYYLSNGVSSGFSITFPKNEKKKYEDLVNMIAKSFMPSHGEQ